MQSSNTTNQSIKLIDSHCHLDCLDLTDYDGDLQTALQFAAIQGVQHFLCVCITLENFPQVLKIAEQYPQVTASVGLHPNEEVAHEPTTAELIALAAHPKVVAIGETGLDYYRSSGDLNWQQQRFREHIRAAKTVNKPLIVHTREARTDTLRIMAEEQADSIGGVMHCFTEDWDTAIRALELGFYISFSGIVTFKNAISLQEVARQVPLDRLLLETDSPYLAPIPYRGKPNQPAYVRHVAEFVADLRDMNLTDLAAATTENFYRLFKIC